MFPITCLFVTLSSSPETYCIITEMKGREKGRMFKKREITHNCILSAKSAYLRIKVSLGESVDLRPGGKPGRKTG